MCPSSLCVPGGREILVIFDFSEPKKLPVSFIHSFIYSTNNYCCPSNIGLYSNAGDTLVNGIHKLHSLGANNLVGKS